jgi:hypothetical protein
LQDNEINQQNVLMIFLAEFSLSSGVTLKAAADNRKSSQLD